MIYGGVKLCTYLLPLDCRRREMVVSVALVTQLRELFLLVFCLFRTEYWNKCVECIMNLQGFDQTHYDVLYNLKLSSLPSKALF